ncbi:hypothetical protein ZWY2020_011929 [Hordeum vulgare]|nr:hypothetical protein ZWY2020_011929 [Hordeum vulgare]
MALPAIPDELVVEILLRLPTPEDLIRASDACVSIRSLVANRAFLRRFRKLHPAPLLGFVDYKGFHPSLPPHPSAPAASVVASAADFSFGFLPAPAFDWSGRSSTAASSSTDPAVTPARCLDPSSRGRWCATPCTCSISCFPRSRMT